MTTSGSQYYDLPESTIVVVIKENSTEDVSGGGVLAADRQLGQMSGYEDR